MSLTESIRVVSERSICLAIFDAISVGLILDFFDISKQIVDASSPNSVKGGISILRGRFLYSPSYNFLRLFRNTSSDCLLNSPNGFENNERLHQRFV